MTCTLYAGTALLEYLNFLHVLGKTSKNAQNITKQKHITTPIGLQTQHIEFAGRNTNAFLREWKKMQVITEISAMRSSMQYYTLMVNFDRLFIYFRKEVSYRILRWSADPASELRGRTTKMSPVWLLMPTHSPSFPLLMP
jgi:hypothetical protein